jgi:hypothetical protein
MGEKCVEFQYTVPGSCIQTREGEYCKPPETKTSKFCLPEELANAYQRWISLLKGAASGQTASAKPAEPQYTPPPAPEKANTVVTWCDYILGRPRCY